MSRKRQHGKQGLKVGGGGKYASGIDNEQPCGGFGEGVMRRLVIQDRFRIIPVCRLARALFGRINL